MKQGWEEDTTAGVCEKVWIVCGRVVPLVSNLRNRSYNGVMRPQTQSVSGFTGVSEYSFPLYEVSPVDVV